MAYDALAESLRLIDAGPPDAVRLSRRVRHVPLAVDVDGPIAVTLFARRGAGHVAFEHHVLVRRDGTWATLGGGGWGTDDDELGDAPPGRDLDASGGGMTHVGGGPGLPDAVRYATVRAGREVATVLVGDRPLRVPRHGWLVAVWPDDRTPPLTALDPAGTVLATRTIRPDRPWLPLTYPG